MADDVKDWTGEERRKILDRRKQDRTKDRVLAKLRAQDQKRKAKADRRQQQICFVCSEPFAAGVGQVVCPRCADDGLRGGKRNRPRF